MYFQDRYDAGRKLAQSLIKYRNQPEVLVLGLPRGGVPVAFEVAKALRAPLDVFLVRKLGVPGHEELAMGAVADGNVLITNDDVIADLGIPDEMIAAEARAEQQEVKRQRTLYRGNAPVPTLKGRIVILVDDGLATGSTMRAAVQALRKLRPKQLIVAVPVGAADVCAKLEREVDEVVCALKPENFVAVGVWYHDFRPTTDATVRLLLRAATEWLPAQAG